MNLATEPANASGAPASAATDAVAIYTALRAVETRPARDDPFAAHVFACALTAAMVDARDVSESVSAACGLDRSALGELIRDWLPGAATYISLDSQPASLDCDEEALQLLTLLSRFGVDNVTTTQWIARIVTTRAMAPRHLWQDLGLVDRSELTRLIGRWFPLLAAANIDNMKWKKFFYRQICELEGFSLCATPTCRECGDFDNCFGEEQGESALARLAR